MQDRMDTDMGGATTDPIDMVTAVIVPFGLGLVTMVTAVIGTQDLDMVTVVTGDRVTGDTVILVTRYTLTRRLP